jgi:hypothetical protein
MSQEQESTPVDCFQLAELEVLQSFDGEVLSDVIYYVWMHKPWPGDHDNLGFLYCIELLFEPDRSLLLTCGEQSTAIQITNAQALVGVAKQLKEVNGNSVLTRIMAGAGSMWQTIMGQRLETIRLARHPESVYYANDAMIFDFGSKSILLKLGEKEGLELSFSS